MLEAASGGDHRSNHRCTAICFLSPLSSMDEHQSPGQRRPPKSEFHIDMYSVNGDPIMVVPDTPDRVSKSQPDNINEGPGLADKRTRDKRIQNLDDRRQNSLVHSCPSGDFDSVFEQTLDTSAIHLRNDPASRMVRGKIFKDASKHHFNHHHKNCGNVPHSRYPHPNRNSGPALVEHVKLAKSPHKIAKEELGVQNVIRAIQPDRGHTAEVSLKSPRNDCKGKAKIGNEKSINCETHAVKGQDNMALEEYNAKSLSRPHQSIRSPSKDRRIRLVRNGFISPHNTAKAKQLAESSVNDHATALSGGSYNVIDDIDKVVAGEICVTRAKGKGVMFHPFSPKDHEHRRADTGCLPDDRGKRKCHETDCRVGKSNNNNISDRYLMGKCSSSLQPVINEAEFCTPITSGKKQKKHESDSCSLRKKPEVICLSSCGESSTSKSMMDHGCSPQRVLDSPIFVGGSSPDLRERDSQFEAMALQVQADEILAHELQEQLYNEIPEAPSDEQELLADNIQRASRGGRHSNAARALPASSTRRQSQPQSLRNRLFRRGAQARLPTSNVARIRRHIHRHSLGRHGVENMSFPSDMDLDMRMGLLEALEAVVNDDIRMVTQLLDSDREFNENDYEMLLALDDNNHQHLGASVAQITNLPESTIQNDSSEICSICLETPVIGDTIRHLPCLHKFHKACIDPWLRRKRSCPICKSDI